MFAIGNDELLEMPAMGKSVSCPNCGKRHRVKEAVDADKKGVPTGMWFYKCGKHSYLAGVGNKDVTGRFRKTRRSKGEA